MRSGMLSRIAESLFWIGRYVERADDTARILDAFEDAELPLCLACQRLARLGVTRLSDVVDAHATTCADRDMRCRPILIVEAVFEYAFKLVVSDAAMLAGDADPGFRHRPGNRARLLMIDEL